MAFTDSYFEQRSWQHGEHFGNHILSWFAVAVVQFAVFFVPLSIWGWWAFAFPPWVIVLAAIVPVMTLTPVDDPTTGLIVTAAVWIGTALIVLAAGLKRRNLAIVSGAVHALLPIITMAMALWLAVQTNGGNLPGG